MASDFDKQFKGIINTVRSTINPDYAIPKDKQHAPMNVRIQRMKVAAEELSNKIKELNSHLASFTTNLNALTDEVQPYLKTESQAQPAASTSESTDAKADAPAATAETKTDAPAATEEAKADSAEPKEDDAKK